MQAVVKTLLPGITGVAVFSFFINALMLSVPLYTLQVYDRVLNSRSAMTLLMLTLVAIGLLLAGGILDAIRNRLLVRMGAAFDTQAGPHAFVAHIKRHSATAGRPSMHSMSDLDIVRRQLSSPSSAALFDLPWVPIFLALLFVFHPILGAVALGGALLLSGLGLLSEVIVRKPFARSVSLGSEASAVADAAERDAEVVHAMGLHRHALKSWQHLRSAGSREQISAGDASGTMSATAKTFRQILQVSILATGAYLAIQDAVSPGVIIAASIIMGRAIAPIEGIVGNWRNFVSAHSAYRRLEDLLRESSSDANAMPLPRPNGFVRAENAMVAVPGRSFPILHGISFELEPGESLGILGLTASGKSTLARLLIGLIAPTAGCVRLDGVDVSRWSREDLGPYVGYIPENPRLLRGTVAQNIARYGEVDPTMVVQAARRANVHEMLQSLPDGYDTDIAGAEHRLSSGQHQRIALARALYGDPVFVVLDEPNSNVDFEGDRGLIGAIRNLKSVGTTTAIISHRQSILACVDKILLLENGRVAAFGPRDQVMSRLAPQLLPLETSSDAA